MKAVRWLTAVLLLCCIAATTAAPWDRKNNDLSQDPVVEAAPTDSSEASSSEASEFAASPTADAAPAEPEASAKPSRPKRTPPSRNALLLELVGFTACALFLVQYILGKRK